MVKRKGNLISSLCNISNILIADSNARKAKKRSKRFIEKHDQNIIDEDMAIAVSFYNLTLTNKRLVLNTTDLETFKEMVITKN